MAPLASAAPEMMLPEEPEAYEYLPGSLRTSSINSFSDFAGMSLLTTSTNGMFATRPTGAKSFTGS